MLPHSTRSTRALAHTSYTRTAAEVAVADYSPCDAAAQRDFALFSRIGSKPRVNCAEGLDFLLWGIDPRCSASTASYRQEALRKSVANSVIVTLGGHSRARQG